VIYPLLVPYAVQAILHMPTLLLASRARVSHIKHALASIVAVAVGVAVVMWALHGQRNPPAAYTLSLHWALFLLAQPPHPSLVIGAWAHAAANAAGALVLAAGAWQLGPPLPVVNTPGFRGDEGARAHLACLLVTDLLAPPLMAALTRILE
jgi:hypothetical protein